MNPNKVNNGIQIFITHYLKVMGDENDNALKK